MCRHCSQKTPPLWDYEWKEFSWEASVNQPEASFPRLYYLSPYPLDHIKFLKASWQYTNTKRELIESTKHVLIVFCCTTPLKLLVPWEEAELDNYWGTSNNVLNVWEVVKFSNARTSWIQIFALQFILPFKKRPCLPFPSSSWKTITLCP